MIITALSLGFIALFAVLAFWARIIGCNRGLFMDGQENE